MDPINLALGFMAAAVIGCTFVGAKFFTPANFGHPVIVNGVWIDGDL